jgi:biopolymer transport protein TolQ
MDIPVMNMIVRSGWVARLMLFILAALSILTWAIIFNRFWYLARIKGALRGLRRAFDSPGPVRDLENVEPALARSLPYLLVKAGLAEYRRILDDARAASELKDWSFFLQSQFQMVNEKFESASLDISRRIGAGFVLLAIASSVAPLVGLLGTVWGIMNSFYQIGSQGSASLPVVAPGIAEALITTIIGLAVAIPALFFYNFFVGRAEAYEDEIEELKTTLASKIKRDIFTLLFGEGKKAR